MPGRAVNVYLDEAGLQALDAACGEESRASYLRRAAFGEVPALAGDRQGMEARMEEALAKLGDASQIESLQRQLADLQEQVASLNSTAPAEQLEQLAAWARDADARLQAVERLAQEAV